MIFYFSGTGNSEYAAKRIAKIINDEVIDLFDKIRNKDFTALSSNTPYVIVVPTYAWRIPHIVTEWLTNTPLNDNGNVYFVMTCGGEIGNAGKYLEQICLSKKLNYKGCKGILMPENYIALFKTPEKAEALNIINQSEKDIEQTAENIKKGEQISSSRIKINDKIKSGIVNDIFYPIFVKSKKFFVTNTCISCGKCEKSCPLNNIKIDNGKPIWGNNCTHCMACICRCPNESIEYGKHSKDLPRYICPKKA